MSEKIKAFPWHDAFPEEQGMDLRDYFAAKALQGLVVDSSIDCRLEIKEVTELSYLMADAMMKAREK